MVLYPVKAPPLPKSHCLKLQIFLNMEWATFPAIKDMTPEWPKRKIDRKASCLNIPMLQVRAFKWGEGGKGGNLAGEPIGTGACQSVRPSSKKEDWGSMGMSLPQRSL